MRDVLLREPTCMQIDESMLGSQTCALDSQGGIECERWIKPRWLSPDVVSKASVYRLDHDVTLPFVMPAESVYDLEVRIAGEG